MIIVERATEDDLEGVLRIDFLTIGDGSRQSYLVDAILGRHCVVARRGEMHIGFAIVDQSFFGQQFIALLIVHPDHRRQGVATALIQYIEKTCPADRLFTATNESNAIMQQLCHRLGFVRSGYVENLDEGDPEIIYVKRL